MSDDKQPFSDEEDPTPVGDTDQAHDEVRSVDLPPGHPSQGEVQRRERGEEQDTHRAAEGEPPSSA